jgi:hypothetical protein
LGLLGMEAWSGARRAFHLQINALPAHRWGEAANVYIFRRTAP